MTHSVEHMKGYEKKKYFNVFAFSCNYIVGNNYIVYTICGHQRATINVQVMKSLLIARLLFTFQFPISHSLRRGSVVP